MTTDQELQLKAKYDQLESGMISFDEFSTWFEQQQWPSDEQTDRMLDAVEMTQDHLDSSADVPEQQSKGHLKRIGDYLHGRTDVKPDSLGDQGMSRDELRHEEDEAHNK